MNNTNNTDLHISKEKLLEMYNSTINSLSSVNLEYNKLKINHKQLQIENIALKKKISELNLMGLSKDYIDLMNFSHESTLFYDFIQGIYTLDYDIRTLYSYLINQLFTIIKPSYITAFMTSVIGVKKPDAEDCIDTKWVRLQGQYKLGDICSVNSIYQVDAKEYNKHYNRMKIIASSKFSTNFANPVYDITDDIISSNDYIGHSTTQSALLGIINLDNTVDRAFGYILIEDNTKLLMLSHNVHKFKLMIQLISVLYKAIFLSTTSSTKATNYLYKSMTDTMTNLYNREQLKQDIDSIYSNARCTYIMFDIDHFKLVNDTYGHKCGDIVIKTLAKHLKNLAKELQGRAYRMGGEEFLIVTSSNSFNIKQCFESVESFRAGFHNHVFSFLGEELTKTISAGIYEEESPSQNPTQSIVYADTSLYVAKRTRDTCYYAQTQEELTRMTKNKSEEETNIKVKKTQ